MCHNSADCVTPGCESGLLAEMDVGAGFQGDEPIPQDLIVVGNDLLGL
jgi:hypothetical protein